MSNLIIIGDQVLKQLNQLPKNPGIYKFLDKDKKIIYIGKAKNLSNRTKSYYLNLKNRSKKVNRLTSEACYLEVILTSTELEALLLEQYAIKEHRPKFNLQFKDDKGYPWIEIGISKEYPSAKSFVGRKKKGELYYGPFPSSRAARDALSLIQKVFKLRDCSDSSFKNRTRPCMQYQIGKCSAPCVTAIKQADYLEEVKSTQMLLNGKGEELINTFYESMDKSAERKLFERAAAYRDKISSLREIQRSQSISGFSCDRDAIAVHVQKNGVKIGVTSVRGGWIVGHENFMKRKEGVNEGIIEAFLSGHYLFVNYCPPIILVEGTVSNKETIQKALSKNHGKKIRINTRLTKKDLGLLNICKKNTKISLKRRKEEGVKDLSTIFKELETQFELKNEVRLIESYDVSHHAGRNAIGGCVAFNSEGKQKDLYRIYNINKINSGNDISSMKEIIQRRFSSKTQKNLTAPDLILIDGGYTHLKSVKDEINNLGVGYLDVLSISKGSRRKPQMDSIHKEDGRAVKVQRDSKVHLFIQELRDEAHRFTITRQRKKEIKSSHKSRFDLFPGVGKKRKSALLRYFGSLDQVSKASSQDLMKVPSIGKKTAETVFTNLHY
tara:strand:+ start:3074 stop:4900 length:1827 start_codon:yes stop_codon:yes gene_type:complete